MEDFGIGFMMKALVVVGGHYLDRAAQGIFKAAIEADRCGELLECLFTGGSATVRDGVLYIIDEEQIKQIGTLTPPEEEDNGDR